METLKVLQLSASSVIRTTGVDIFYQSKQI